MKLYIHFEHDEHDTLSHTHIYKCDTHSPDSIKSAFLQSYAHHLQNIDSRAAVINWSEIESLRAKFLAFTPSDIRLVDDTYVERERLLKSTIF